MKNNAEGSLQGSTGFVSARGVAFPPDVAESIRLRTMQNVSAGQIEAVNEYLGDIYMSRRRLPVKLALGAVILFDCRLGEPYSANEIAHKCLRYINKNMSVTANSVSGFLKVMFTHGLVGYEQQHRGRVWWKAV